MQTIKDTKQKYCLWAALSHCLMFWGLDVESLRVHKRNFLHFIYYTVAWKKWQTTPQPQHALHRLSCGVFLSISFLPKDLYWNLEQYLPARVAAGPMTPQMTLAEVWAKFCSLLQGSEAILVKTRFSGAPSTWWEQSGLLGPWQPKYPSHFFSTDQLHITLIPQKFHWCDQNTGLFLRPWNSTFQSKSYQTLGPQRTCLKGDNSISVCPRSTEIRPHFH